MIPEEEEGECLHECRLRPPVTKLWNEGSDSYGALWEHPQMPSSGSCPSSAPAPGLSESLARGSLGNEHSQPALSESVSSSSLRAGIVLGSSHLGGPEEGLPDICWKDSQDDSREDGCEPGAASGGTGSLLVPGGA